MKNMWMAVITIITICCVVGGTLFHMGGFVSEGRLWGHHKETTGVVLEAFNAVDLDADLMDISVKEGSEFYLSCEYTDGLEPIYEVKNGTLFIKQRKHRFNNWKINSHMCRLSLTIPYKTAMDSVDISTAMGNIDMEGIISSKCEIQSNAGNCEIKMCSFDDTDANTNMGNVTISHSALGRGEADSDLGDIKIIECTFSDLNAETAMGDVSLSSEQGLDGYHMDLDTSMGSVRVNGHDEGSKYYQSGDEGELELKTDMGSIRLNHGKKE